MKKLRVIVACEFSGIVREAFRKRGFDAWSCDLLPTEIPGQHIQDDVLRHLDEGWDLMIAHPPCTYLANSGVRWLSENNPRTGELYKERYCKMQEAAKFFNTLLNADIPHICIENPIQHQSARFLIRHYDQIIQPWRFGYDASKATCLWLKGLPKLKPTKLIEPHYRCRCGYRFEYELGKYGCPNCCGEKTAKLVFGNQTPSGQNNEPPGENQAKNRSRTFQGVAEAMATQWNF